MGRFLLLVVLAVLVSGLFAPYIHKLPFLGKLPGDIHIKRGNSHYYFPLGSSLVIAVVLTLLVNLILK